MVSTPAPKPNERRVIPLRPRTAPPASGATGVAPQRQAATPAPTPPRSVPTAAPREPLWRDLVGDALRRERQAQERTLKDVAEAARISMPYLSELERGRKEASSEVLAAAARALGLGLADLLQLAQGELARQEQVRRLREIREARLGRAPRTPTARHDGLCLAA